jgi:hypothetical protein
LTVRVAASASYRSNVDLSRWLLLNRKRGEPSVPRLTNMLRLRAAMGNAQGVLLP